MIAAEELVKQVRADAAVKAISERHRRGVEAFLQAYQYVANGNPGEAPLELCEASETYLTMTANPPLSEMEWRAAETTRDVLIRLAE